MSVPVGIAAVVADVAAYTTACATTIRIHTGNGDDDEDDDDDVITVWGQLSRSTVTAAAAATV